MLWFREHAQYRSYWGRARLYYGFMIIANRGRQCFNCLIDAGAVLNHRHKVVQRVLYVVCNWDRGGGFRAIRVSDRESAKRWGKARAFFIFLAVIVAAAAVSMVAAQNAKVAKLEKTIGGSSAPSTGGDTGGDVGELDCVF